MFSIIPSLLSFKIMLQTQTGDLEEQETQQLIRNLTLKDSINE